jgi:hypothetical protein
LIAQLLHHAYEGDCRLLNDTIRESLDSDGVTGTPDSRKTFGKNIRYKIGTVAVIQPKPANHQKIFMTAFATTNYDRTTIKGRLVDQPLQSLGGR